METQAKKWIITEHRTTIVEASYAISESTARSKVAENRVDSITADHMVRTAIPIHDPSETSE